jgi:hypothetical protein
MERASMKGYLDMKSPFKNIKGPSQNACDAKNKVTSLFRPLPLQKA